MPNNVSIPDYTMHRGFKITVYQDNGDKKFYAQVGSNEAYTATARVSQWKALQDGVKLAETLAKINFENEGVKEKE